MNRSLLRGQAVVEQFPLPVHDYLGVTEFRRKDVPGWLWHQTHAIEEQHGDPNSESHSYATGTTDLTGVSIDYGRRQVACILTPSMGEVFDP